MQEAGITKVLLLSSLVGMLSGVAMAREPQLQTLPPLFDNATAPPAGSVLYDPFYDPTYNPSFQQQKSPQPALPNSKTAYAAPSGRAFVIQETFRDVQPAAPVQDFGVVGLDLKIQADRYPLVEAVFRGTPAQIQGFQPGDLVLAINGVSTLGKNLHEVDAMISDRPGEQVEFAVARNREMLHKSLTVMSLREAPHMASVLTP